MREGFERVHNDDGSVTFAATLGAAEALRADPEVLLALEDGMRDSLEAITGRPSKASLGARLWRYVRRMVGLIVYVTIVVFSLRVLWLVAVATWNLL